MKKRLGLMYNFIVSKAQKILCVCNVGAMALMVSCQTALADDIFSISSSATDSIIDNFADLYKSWGIVIILFAAFIAYAAPVNDKVKQIAKGTFFGAIVVYILCCNTDLIKGTLETISGWFGGGGATTNTGAGGTT